jgi:hypothetical protein
VITPETCVLTRPGEKVPEIPEVSDVKEYQYVPLPLTRYQEVNDGTCQPSTYLSRAVLLT